MLREAWVVADRDRLRSRRVRQAPRHHPRTEPGRTSMLEGSPPHVRTTLEDLVPMLGGRHRERVADDGGVLHLREGRDLRDDIVERPGFPGEHPCVGGPGGHDEAVVGAARSACSCRGGDDGAAHDADDQPEHEDGSPSAPEFRARAHPDRRHHSVLSTTAACVRAATLAGIAATTLATTNAAGTSISVRSRGTTLSGTAPT